MTSRSSGPSPSTWNATCASPLLAYCVRSASTTSRGYVEVPPPALKGRTPMADGRLNTADRANIHHALSATVTIIRTSPRAGVRGHPRTCYVRAPGRSDRKLEQQVCGARTQLLDTVAGASPRDGAIRV